MYEKKCIMIFINLSCNCSHISDEKMEALKIPAAHSASQCPKGGFANTNQEDRL